MLRFAVPGGDCRPLEVMPGDIVTITNREGLQSALLLTLGADREPEAVLDDAEIESALAGLNGAAAGFASGRDRAVLSGRVLFDEACEAGARITLEASQPASWLIAAPGLPMAPDAQNPPTDLDVTLQPRAGGRLPPPLAAVKQEHRIAAGTASAYRVRKGDTIQIIDVEGRQCSDFLAFDAAALAEGDEWGLDPAATRTLMGNAVPAPGLHSRFFDARLQPLVEVVVDTVGRHDSFMLACSAKYYDDMGYPGHDNCTDNFNRSLAPHGVAARQGWPAINFFYNTAVSSCGAITMDEPWSRPGDYVLLRALTDLVCASSSCADDIDPANGWTPTDIHVRIHDGQANIPRGIAHRMTHDASPVLTRESGFHPRTAALSRHLVEYRGFWLPNAYGGQGPIEEYWACRQAVSVMDLSALRKFEVVGPDAEALLQLATTRDVRRLAVGQVVYTAMCFEHGGMIDDGTVFRLGQDNFRWICGDSYCGIWLRELAGRDGLRATVRESTNQLHNIAVQGPRSRDILADLVTTPAHQPSLAELKWFRFTIGRIGGVPVVVSRTGYTGELGYEIWCHPDRAVALWDAVFEAGRPQGLQPIGLQALDMLRVEAGLIFAGQEFDDQIDPFEAGIGFAVTAEKPDDFIGRNALQQRRGQPQRRLMGLDIEGNETIGHGDPVYRGRAQVGVVTSATRSPILRRSIALARLDVSFGEVGTRLEIGKLDGHSKRIGATVAAFPAYDPKKTRVRA